MWIKDVIQYFESLGQTKVGISQESNPGGKGGDLAWLVTAQAKVRSWTEWPIPEPELLATKLRIWRQFGGGQGYSWNRHP